MDPLVITPASRREKDQQHLRERAAGGNRDGIGPKRREYGKQ